MTTHCSFFHDRELSEAIGYYTDLQKQEEDQQTLKQYVNLKLSASGKACSNCLVVFVESNDMTGL